MFNRMSKLLFTNESEIIKINFKINFFLYIYNFEVINNWK